MNLRIVVFLISLSFAHEGVADDSSPIGFSSVAEALSAMRADPEADISVEGGWTIVAKEANGEYVLWSFTPDSHPAHPAAVKREVVEIEGVIYISMKVLCQASKAACDTLVQGFEDLNSQIKKNMAGGT